MNFLIFAIICSVAVSVLLKVSRKKGIDVSHAIAMNYIVAIGCSYFLLKPPVEKIASLEIITIMPFLALGVLLPTVFIILAKAVEQAGIVRTDAAQRLSLALSVLGAFVIFGDVLTLNKSVGIAIGFLALLALLYKPNQSDKNGGMLWLVGVWLGFGVIDLLLKLLSKSGATAVSLNLFIIFIIAAVLMWLYVFYRGQKIKKADIFAGLILGLLNFGNILFYLKAHQAFKNDPSLVFAGMNLGVIILGTLVGALLFKEKVSMPNKIGILLAIIAVASLYYLDKFLQIVGIL